MRTVGEYLIHALHSLEVRHVFGIPGVHNLEIYRGLTHSAIRHISGRHEQAVGFMADGYARVSRRPGVCFTITGPGVTNILTAMGQAYGDSVPILVIASQSSRADMQGRHGELHGLRDQCALVSQVAAATFSVAEPAQLPAALGESFALFAARRPRPVFIEIPHDVLAASAVGLALPFPIPRLPVCPANQLDEASTVIRSARNPVVVAGGGAVQAVDEIRRLVEHLGAPLVMTTNARGLLTPRHPLGVPLSPSLMAVRELVAAADVVLAIGTEFASTDYDLYSIGHFPNHPNLVRIDIDANQLTSNVSPTIGLCGQAAATIRALLQRDLGPPRSGAGATRAAETRSRGMTHIVPTELQEHIVLLNLIRDALPTALLVGDSTQLVYAGNLGFAAESPGSWFNSATGFGTLGYALPASIGASLASPHQPVVCLVGDGGLQYSIGELASLRDLRPWIAILVWNNHGLGEIRSEMVAANIEPIAVAMTSPDLFFIAKAYGIHHQLIGSEGELGAALRQFGEDHQVCILELRAARFE